jgi:hypothetical protein
MAVPLAAHSTWSGRAPARVVELARASRRPGPIRPPDFAPICWRIWRSAASACACGAARLRLGAARGVQVALELLQVRLGLLEVEAVARAGRHQLAVLLDALARELDLRGRLLHARGRALDAGFRRRDLGLGPGELLLELLAAALRVGERRLERPHVPS